jgi:hypothetical protein
MPILKELQKNFKHHLVSGDDNILSSIVSTEELSNVDRLAIYGNAYYARLEEVLEGDFEAIHTLVGDEEFSTLCRRYTDAHPSRFFSVRWFGQHMAEFLQSTTPYSDHPYLFEMATFEWRFTDAFDAEDSEAITEADVAQIPVESWPTLMITLHPSVSWFSYEWNILPVWRAIKDQADIPVLKKLENPETCMVWRQGLITKYRTLEVNESLLIQAAAENKNFSDWCELLIDAGEPVEEVPMMTAGILKTWLSLGMITAINYQQD